MITFESKIIEFQSLLKLISNILYKLVDNKSKMKVVDNKSKIRVSKRIVSRLLGERNYFIIRPYSRLNS